VSHNTDCICFLFSLHNIRFYRTIPSLSLALHKFELLLFLAQHFMELEPVVELEEDSGAGEDSPTSSGSPSMSPQPYPEDMWAKVSTEQ
jgi:hypothetical protein